MSNYLKWNMCLNLLTMYIVCKKYIDFWLFLKRKEILLFIKQCLLNFTSGNGYELIKVGAKFLFDHGRFLIL